jgi:hypothetical protein
LEIIKNIEIVKYIKNKSKYFKENFLVIHKKIKIKKSKKIKKKHQEKNKVEKLAYNLEDKDLIIKKRI